MLRLPLFYGLATLLFTCVSGASSKLDDIDLKDIAYLSASRPQIIFPPYSPENRTLVAQQALKLFEIYGNRQVKIHDFGPGVDPIPRTQDLVNKAANLSDHDFHMTLFRIFSDLRDLHQNYLFPVPYACYRAFIPLRFSRIQDKDIHRHRAAVSTVYTRFSQFMPSLPSIEIGDELISVQGEDLESYMSRQISIFSGANADAGFIRALDGLIFRSMSLLPLPETNEVAFGFKKMNGTEYKVALPYLSYLSNPRCPYFSASAPIAPELPGGMSEKLQYAILASQNAHSTMRNDLAVNAYQYEFTETFGDSSRQLVQSGILDNLKKTESDTMQYGWIRNQYGNFGYVTLVNFLPNLGNYDECIDILRSLLLGEFRDSDGLIFDLRDNGGGSVQYAEGIAQLFTSERIEVTGFRAINNDLNRRIFQHPDFGPLGWTAVLKTTPVNATWTQPLVKLSANEFANSKGRAYFKPVAVLNNARCYSACELFSASMQDWNAAKIWGEDSETGGGGCNVVQNFEMNKYLPQEFVVTLPGAQSMRLAWRQTVREGKNKGKLIEDIGVVSDGIAQPLSSDIVGTTQTQFDAIAKDLRDRGAMYTDDFFIIGNLTRDVIINQPFFFSGTAKNIKSVKAYLDPNEQDERQKWNVTNTTTVTNDGKWQIQLPPMTYFSLESRIIFEGYHADGSFAFQASRMFRVVSNVTYSIEANKTWVWEPKEASVTTTIRRIRRSDPLLKSSFGWNLVNSTLQIGNGTSYPPRMHAWATWRYDVTKCSNATITVTYDADMGGSDRVEINASIPPQLPADSYFGSIEGKAQNGTFSASLEKYCHIGKNSTIMENRKIRPDVIDWTIVFRSGKVASSGHFGFRIHNVSVTAI